MIKPEDLDDYIDSALQNGKALLHEILTETKQTLIIQINCIKELKIERNKYAKKIKILERDLKIQKDACMIIRRRLKQYER